jgi:hypothetical protein
MAGVGKTRLVHEVIVRLDGALHLVLYTNDGGDAENVARLLANDRNARCILVADECPVESRVNIGKTLKGHMDRVRAVCIDNSGERPIGGEGELCLEELAPASVEKVLAENFPLVPPDRRRAYAELSGGYIRFAADLCEHDAEVDGARAGLFQVLPLESIQRGLAQTGVEGARMIANQLQSPSVSAEGTPQIHPLTEYVLTTWGDDDIVFGRFAASTHNLQMYTGDIRIDTSTRGGEGPPFALTSDPGCAEMGGTRSGPGRGTSAPVGNSQRRTVSRIEPIVRVTDLGELRLCSAAASRFPANVRDPGCRIGSHPCRSVIYQAIVLDLAGREAQPFQGCLPTLLSGSESAQVIVVKGVPSECI